MQLKKALTQLNGLQFMIENLDLKSAMGKRFLVETPWFVSKKVIETELNLIEKTLENLETKSAFISKIQTRLSQLRDISGSIKNIGNKLILDDIQLFEVKHFAMVVQEIIKLQKEHQLQLIEISGLEEVVKILDPDKTNIPSFYIYDSYSEELSIIRKELKIHKSKKFISEEEGNKELDLLFLQSEKLESTIREQLCNQLVKYHKNLEKAFESVAHLDVIIAKAIQAKQLGLSKPSIAKGLTIYKKMFNPQIKEHLQLQQKEYQSIDIQLYKSLCFITGANMAGKTVLLKTVALCQYLFQFGFYIPAENAEICLVDKLLLLVGDLQSEENGLSSFASEMLKVNEMVAEVLKNDNVFVLIDELARTTNPIEGKAIVNAVATIFNENNVRSLITTHYSGLNTECRKLRVKGLLDSISTKNINAKNVNDFIDYSLVEDNVGDAPQEALRICELLGIHEEIVNKAQIELKK